MLETILNPIRRLIWWWQDRPYVRLSLDDCEVVDQPRLEMTPGSSGAATTVNL